jgi:anti-sigma factor (TIGR02949 family)
MNPMSDRMNEREEIGCEEALRRLATYLDRELGEDASSDVERHLEKCRSCFSRAEFERRLKERIRRELQIADVPEAYERRIRSLLRRAAGAP